MITAMDRATTPSPYDARVLPVGSVSRDGTPIDATFIACDMGNSYTRFGVYTLNGLDFVMVISSRAFTERMTGELSRWLIDLKVRVPHGCPSAISSVTPHNTYRAGGALRDNCGASPVWLGRDKVIPIRNLTREPTRVGTDRLVAALAAHELTNGACIVIDAGTAITVDAVSAEGEFLGGAIAPGPGTMLRALMRNTEQLNDTDLTKLPEGCGKTPEEAMSLGILGMCAGGVELLFDAMRNEVGQVPIIGTGGALKLIAPYLVSKVQEEPFLNFEGIRLAASITSDEEIDLAD